MVYVYIILDIQVHEGGYHWGGHSAMQSHVPWGHFWGDWPPAVADLLCIWHRGPLIPVIRCPSCWDVGMSMFMLTFYSCWLFCLLSVCWICHISCLSVECSKVNRIKHSFKSKQAKKIANDMFSVLLSISFHVNVSIGEKKTACIHKIGRSLSCKASVRLAAFKRGWTIEYRFTNSLHTCFMYTDYEKNYGYGVFRWSGVWRCGSFVWPLIRTIQT